MEVLNESVLPYRSSVPIIGIYRQKVNRFLTAWLSFRSRTPQRPQPLPRALAQAQAAREEHLVDGRTARDLRDEVGRHRDEDERQQVRERARHLHDEHRSRDRRLHDAGEIRRHAEHHAVDGKLRREQAEQHHRAREDCAAARAESAPSGTVWTTRLTGHCATVEEGQELMRGRRLLTIDEDALYAEAQQRADAIRSRAGITLPNRFPTDIG